MKGELNRVLDALDTGVKLEATGMKFYSRAASEVDDPRGRQTLRFLANEERDHLEFIKDLKKSLERKEEIVNRHQKKRGSRVFPPLEEYIEKVRVGTGDKKILEEAEEIEKRSINFYTEAREGVSEESNQEIFNVLIKEEEEHLKLVQQMSDYMVLHGVWSGLEDYFANE